jgi:hypothetical protein
MNNSSAERDLFDGYGDLLTHQYYETVGARRASSGPRTLMFAVLEDGIRCYLANLHAARPSRLQRFEEARAWLEDRADISAFSFETLCRTFDIDAEKLRTQLHSMSQLRLPRRLVGISRSVRPRPPRARKRSKRPRTAREASFPLAGGHRPR